ncbi:MAG: hypothetical protein M9897_01185 [Brumimicrobium sp.]|nr:hypothetical protein [Brumimicrobium sp.]
MQKSKVNLGLKSSGEFNLEERRQIIEEYLQSDCTKREIWYKYTGQEHEKGYLLNWMRQLGYQVPEKRVKFVSTKTLAMSNKAKESVEVTQLKEKIKQLEKALVSSELRATAYETMIEIAEKELKISIKKKSNTKTIFTIKMRQPKIGLSKLCWLFGVTRQAYYQSFYRAEFPRN